MKTLSIDLETFSDIDIGKSGVYRYAGSPNFDILLFGYSIDGSPVEVIDLASGEELPEFIINAILSDEVIKTAFNSQFERICLMKYLSRNKPVYLDPSSWRCSEVQAAMLGLPLSLDGVGKVLKLEQQKMSDGKALIRYFCIPCRATAANGGRTRNLPKDAPEKWAIFKNYNIRDVEVELAIREKLASYPISDKEQQFYVLDQRINDRGLLVDMDLVNAAISCNHQFTVAATEKAYELTGLQNPNSVSQLKEWLKDRGVEVESLSKKAVSELVEDAEGEVEEALKLRLLMAKTSVKKYEAVERAVASDGRVHGLFQFYGANRTGRWCLAKGTPVRVKTTDDRIMEKAIEEVMLTDQVWDGDQWVSHEGAVYSGDKEVITWDGITATPEHIVYISDDEKISLGEARSKEIKLWKPIDVPTPNYIHSEGISPTYDIINAGPKNRFMAAGRIVSNSGRLVQFQNLPQNHLKDLNLARNLVKEGRFEDVELLFGNTPNILSELIRTTFIPKPNHRFIVADFSAIEARVISWLAGEKWRLEVFSSHGKIYEAASAMMFHVPIESVTKGSPLRQKGKISELACIAEGELVLTDKGLVPIENITTGHKLWDGEEWVSHEGVIYKGKRKVIEYEGLRATEDHLVWIEGESKPVFFGYASSSSSHLLQTGDGRETIWLGKNNKSRKAMEQKVESLLRTNTMCKLQKHSMDASRQPKKGDIKGMPKLFSTKTNTKMVRSKINRCKIKMSEFKPSTVLSLWRKRDRIQISLNIRGRSLDFKECGECESEFGNGSNRQQWPLRKRKYSICTEDCKSRESGTYCSINVGPGILALCKKCGNKKIILRDDKGANYCRCGKSNNRKKKKLETYRSKVRVYDILNAGRNNRFTVSGKLVHNCGYGGGVGALKAMGALDMGVEEHELQSLIDNWRAANPHIVSLWWDVDKAAIDAVKERGRTSTHGINFTCKSGMLFVALPSGRNLVYVKPKLSTNKFGREGLTYEGIGTTKKWERIETYGPKIVENLTQAIARDILAEAMLRLDNSGFNIVAHCHDEVIIEAPKNFGSLKDVCNIMAIEPDWVKKLPLRADGFECGWYQK